jgi:hypothetical protein
MAIVFKDVSCVGKDGGLIPDYSGIFGTGPTYFSFLDYYTKNIFLFDFWQINSGTIIVPEGTITRESFSEFRFFHIIFQISNLVTIHSMFVVSGSNLERIHTIETLSECVHHCRFSPRKGLNGEENKLLNSIEMIDSFSPTFCVIDFNESGLSGRSTFIESCLPFAKTPYLVFAANPAKIMIEGSGQPNEESKNAYTKKSVLSNFFFREALLALLSFLYFSLICFSTFSLKLFSSVSPFLFLFCGLFFLLLYFCFLNYLTMASLRQSSCRMQTSFRVADDLFSAFGAGLGFLLCYFVSGKNVGALGNVVAILLAFVSLFSPL